MFSSILFWGFTLTENVNQRLYETVLYAAISLGILLTTLGKGWLLKALVQPGMTWSSVLYSYESAELYKSAKIFNFCFEAENPEFC